MKAGTKASSGASNFQEAHTLFLDTFESIEMETEGAYSQERGQSGYHLYFYPYNPGSPYWTEIGRLHILEGNSHYAVFDPDGNFAVHRRDRDTFFNAVIIRDTGGQVSDLTGRRKRDLQIAY